MSDYKYSVIKNRYILSILFVIVTILLVQSFVSNNASLLAVESEEDTKSEIDTFTSFINIPIGSSAAEISGILKNAELIDSSYAFEIYIRNEGYADRLRAGEYEIESNLNYDAIVNILLIGPPLKTFELTTTEGLWLSETIESIAVQTGYDYSSLVNTLTSGSVKSKYLTDESLKEITNWEGLLFPDTYKFSVDADGAEIFQTMVDQLEFVINNIKKTENIPSWLQSEYELLIIASLIETEAKLDEDRPLVASVIRNRLELDMPLQLDSTILYALGERRTQVLLKDLQVDSVYNTYKYNNLPPTPISSFGKASIDGIFQNLDTKFIYYLLTDKNGDMTFTESYEEFINLKNKAKNEGVIP